MSARRLLETLWGEFWLFPGGKWVEADSNGASGQGHLDYALAYARKELADYFHVKPVEDDMEFAQSLCPFLRAEAAKRKDWPLAKTLRSYVIDGGYYDAADEGIRTLFPQHIELFAFVMGTGARDDLREWVSRKWGWVALRGNQAEAADVTDATLKTFVTGVLDILATYGQPPAADDRYYLNRFSGGRSTTLTITQMEAGDYSAGDTTGTQEPSGRNAALAKLDAQAVPSFYAGKLESLSETTIRQYDPEVGGEELAAAAIANEMTTPLDGERSQTITKLKTGVKLVVDFRRELRHGKPEINGQFYDDSGKYGRERRLKLSPVNGRNVAHVTVWYANKHDLPGIQSRIAMTIAHELGHFRSPPVPLSDERYRRTKDGTERSSDEIYRMTATEVAADASAIRQLLLRDPHLSFDEAALTVLTEMIGLSVARRLLRDADYVARLRKQVSK